MSTLAAASTTTGSADGARPERVPASGTGSPTEPSAASTTETVRPEGWPHASSRVVTEPVGSWTDTVSCPPPAHPFEVVTTAGTTAPWADASAGAVTRVQPAAIRAPAAPAISTRAPGWSCGGRAGDTSRS